MPRRLPNDWFDRAPWGTTARTADTPAPWPVQLTRPEARVVSTNAEAVAGPGAHNAIGRSGRLPNPLLIVCNGRPVWDDTVGDSTRGPRRGNMVSLTQQQIAAAKVFVSATVGALRSDR